ncbi:2612_t:CDS:2 [Acaulospora morrowiae]|uniref:2612_t:CDS:1 n=1 Tax=Acaulospora morrowiae TaxID=94023 RepID=A0A9N8WC14_9GLOM|nr:2612_t:CDS:2 [Acaulospora morrowiae]
MTDEELGELIDFALNIVNKLESENKEHLNQIVRLAVDKNDAFMNIWRALDTSKDESAKIRKFISLMNIRFNMEDSIILTHASFLPITINDVFEFLNILTPASAMKTMLSPLQFDDFRRKHQALIHSRKKGDIRS